MPMFERFKFNLICLVSVEGTLENDELTPITEIYP